MKKFDAAVIGGDKRTAYMVPILEEKGYRVICYGIQKAEETGKEAAEKETASSLKEAVESAHAVITGTPMLKNGMLWGGSGFKKEDSDRQVLLDALRQGQQLFAGVIPSDMNEECKKKGVICHDFMKEETIAVFNAVATAEGAVAEAIRNKDTNLHGSRVLVIGYGRCGGVLCDKLKGLNARVTVCCRKPEAQAWARVLGLDTLDLTAAEHTKGKLSQFEYVFNTVPEVILKEDELRKMNRDVLIIDIASGMGGIDWEAASQLGIHALQCLGLPGKYAAKTSAECLAEFTAGVLKTSGRVK